MSDTDTLTPERPAGSLAAAFTALSEGMAAEKRRLHELVTSVTGLDDPMAPLEERLQALCQEVRVLQTRKREFDNVAAEFVKLTAERNQLASAAASYELALSSKNDTIRALQASVDELKQKLAKWQSDTGSSWKKVHDLNALREADDRMFQALIRMVFDLAAKVGGRKAVIEVMDELQQVVTRGA